MSRDHHFCDLPDLKQRDTQAMDIFRPPGWSGSRHTGPLARSKKHQLFDHLVGNSK